LTEISVTLTENSWVWCHDCPRLETIPLTQVFQLHCYNCPLLSAKVIKPSYLFKCGDCPLLEINPAKFKKTKKRYINTLRLSLEIRFNEIYWAPTGQGALELFEKYQMT
jgi:hypothetical protein